MNEANDCHQLHKDIRASKNVLRVARGCKLQCLFPSQLAAFFGGELLFAFSPSTAGNHGIWECQLQTNYR